MKTSILKKATLVNKGVWTTTITWATILSENGSNNLQTHILRRYSQYVTCARMGICVHHTHNKVLHSIRNNPKKTI